MSNIVTIMEEAEISAENNAGVEFSLLQKAEESKVSFMLVIPIPSNISIMLL